MYALWFVWPIMLIDLVALVHIMSSILWSFQFPKIWDIANMQKHVILFTPNFSQNPKFTSNWIIWVNPSRSWQGCVYDTYTQTICYEIQMNTINCACECIVVQIQNCSSIVWCFRLPPNHVDSHSQEHIPTSNAETSRYRRGKTDLKTF